MKKLALLCFVGAAAFGSAQSFNIDFDGAPGTVGAGVPAATFGGAGGASWAGTWISVAAGASSFSLGGTATITDTGLSFASNNQLYSGDDLALMGDISDPTPAGTTTFNGLANGLYDVIVYSQAPDSAADVTAVTIGSNTQNVGGAWGGSYVLGNTHALFTNVNVTGGTLTISTAVVTGFSSVNGIQLHQQAVPEPSSLIALGLGGLAVLRFRRKK